MLRTVSTAMLAALAAFALTLGACSKDEGGDTPAADEEPTEATDEEEATTDEAPEPTDEQAAPALMEDLMPAYATIREALFNDQGEPVAEAANKLAEAARTTGETAPAAMKPHLEAMAEHAAAMAEMSPDQMDEMRMTFGEISKPMVAMMEAMPEMAEGHHVFECPMAKGYKRWVQKEADLANPYMGQEMPTCGSEVSMMHGKGGHMHEGGEADHMHEGSEGGHMHEGGGMKKGSGTE